MIISYLEQIQHYRLVWVAWGLLSLALVNIVSLTSLIILPISVSAYILFIAYVLCKEMSKDLRDLFSSLGLTMILFLKHKQGTETTPSWSKVAERITTLFGILCLIHTGKGTQISLSIVWFFAIHKLLYWKRERNNRTTTISLPHEANGDKFHINEAVPLEVWVHIFSFLDAPELCVSSQVCHQWNEISKVDLLWKNLFNRLKTMPPSYCGPNSPSLRPYRAFDLRDEPMPLEFLDDEQVRSCNFRELYIDNCLCPSQVQKHNKREDAWIILRGKVFSITSFLAEHPGGENILLRYAGADATQAFQDVGHSDLALKLLKDFEIGTLQWPSRKKTGVFPELVSHPGNFCTRVCEGLDAIQPFTLLFLVATLNYMNSQDRKSVV